MDERERAFAAVADGRVDDLRQLLRARPELAGSRRDDGVSLLLYACYHRRPGVIDAIASAGLELDLFEAAATGDVTALNSILDRDPSAIGSYSSDGWTPLHLAAFFGQPGVVEVLLARGASVGARSRKPLENTPLNAAAAGNDIEACRILLDAGADPNARQAGGYVPLHAAAQNGNATLAALLLERGADREMTTDDGRTALDLARQAGREGFDEMLGV